MPRGSGTEDRTSAKKAWLSAVTGRMAKATGALLACAALMNGANDLYRAWADLPTGDREQVNDDLFRKNFAVRPTIEQPFDVGAANMKVRLLLRVYPSGDLYVKYGNFDQWLPFKSVQVASASILPEAFAQMPLPPSAVDVLSPAAQHRRPIYIDLDKLKNEQARVKSALPPDADRIEMDYVLAEMKDDNPFLLDRSIATYTKKFLAKPGYRFTSFDFRLTSASHYSPGSIDIVDNGNAIVATFKLRSGAALKRYKGWVQGTLKTEQHRIE